MISGFIYNGKTTYNILNVPLMLCSFDNSTDLSGSTRTTVNDELTIYNDIVNEYGTTYNKKTYNYALIKSNGDLITYEEQNIIESWLMSSQFSMDLKLAQYDNDTNNVIEIVDVYFGKFISTSWKCSRDGYIGCEFEFEANGAYPKRYYSHDYTILNNQKITINCITDELEKYIYPTLTIKKLSSTGQISIINETDNNNTMELMAYEELPIVIDCNNCILTDATQNGVVTFNDLGWEDVDNIYWLRFKHGKNVLRFSGNFEINISYTSVVKKVGDWIL